MPTAATHFVRYTSRSGSSNANKTMPHYSISLQNLTAMESTTFIIDDAEFVKEALAILDSFADEHFGDVLSLPSLLVQRDYGVPVAVEDVIQAVQEDDNLSSTLEAFTLGREQEECPAIPHNQPDQTNCGDPKTTIPRGQGQGRIRIRKQLIQLRSVVKKMETHLETLKSPNSPRLDACADSEALVATSENPSNQIGVWKNIALMQFRARREAELHNTQLRKNLVAQLILSERVMKLLQSKHPHSLEFLSEDP